MGSAWALQASSTGTTIASSQGVPVAFMRPTTSILKTVLVLVLGKCDFRSVAMQWLEAIIEGERHRRADHGFFLDFEHAPVGKPARQVFDEGRCRANDRAAVIAIPERDRGGELGALFSKRLGDVRRWHQLDGSGA